MEIKKKAKEAGLCSYLVMDAGRTQIASGSKTVLAIGPGDYSSTTIPKLLTNIIW
jgi:PTH2 family peptidyl-tRNA hydrolase